LSLAIGIVVDDAIMVLENIIRYREKGKKRRAAALIGAREITFAAVATSVSLVGYLFAHRIYGRPDWPVSYRIRCHHECSRDDFVGRSSHADTHACGSILMMQRPGVEKVGQVFESGFERLKRALPIDSFARTG
jgi:hypothetical protein